MLENLYELLKSRGYHFDYAPNYIELRYCESHLLISISDGRYHVRAFDNNDMMYSEKFYKRLSYLYKHILKVAR